MEINTYRLHQDQFNSIQNQLQPNLENGVVQSVDARRLHQWLEVGKDFSTWMKDQIERADLVEHEDYEVFTKNGKNPLGGRPAKEYALSPDAAKEIAMMRSSDKGKLIRNYFLDCEKKVNKPEITATSPRAQLFLELARQAEEIERQQLLIQEKTEDVKVMKNTLSNREFEKLLNATDLSRQLSANPEWSTIEGNRRLNWNPSSHDIMNYLRDKNFIFKNGSQVQQKCVDRYGDVVIVEPYGFKSNVKFNVHSEGFVLFIKEMKKFMIENKIGLAKSGYLPGIEW